MLAAATAAAARVGGSIHVSRRRWSRLPDLRTPRHGLGGAALGNRVVALKGGVVPGLSASPTIEFLDVPARASP